MKNLLVAGAAIIMTAAVLGGCSSAPPDEGTVKPGAGVAQNPGGKPRNDQEAAEQAGMQKTGNAMNADQMKGAAAMAAAKARAGGK